MHGTAGRAVAPLVVAVAIACGLVAQPARARAAERPEGRVLVLPFRDVAHVGRIYWLTEAAAVLLDDDLHRLGLPVVTREDRRRAFDRLQIPVDATLTDATAIRIARLVGASQIVLGTLGLDSEAGTPDRLVAHVRRIRIDAGRLDAPLVERAPLPDLFALFARLSRRLVPAATVTEQQLVDGHPPLAAFQDYVKGLLAQNPVTQIRYLRSSLALSPELDRARLALWDLYSDQGDDEQAFEAVKAVAAGSRFAAQAAFCQALSLVRLKRYEDAWKTLSDLSDRHPSGAVLNDLGTVALDRGGADWLRQAAYYFTRAIKADPDNADYCFNLGYTCWLQQDATQAVHWLREAVRRDPADGDAHFVLAAALRASGEIPEAGRERALAHQLSSVYAGWERNAAGGDAVPRDLARLETALDGPLRVQSTIVESRQQDRQSTAAFYFSRAQKLYAQQEDREATADLKRCLFLSPYEPGAQLLLGRIYLREHRTQEAIAALKISIWSRETPEAHTVLARAYLQAGDRDSARAEASRALALDPRADEARAVLTEIGKPDAGAGGTSRTQPL